MKTIKKVAEVFTGGNEIATSITSSSTNSEVAGAKAVYDYGERNVMQLTLPSNFNPSANHVYEVLPMALTFSIGSKLTFNNSTHDITIGEGVKTIKIYAFAGLNAVTVNERKYIQVYKNGTSGIFLNMTYMSSTDVRSIQFETYVSVQSGDTISLKYYGSLGDNVATNRAILSVEVVELETTPTRSLNATLNTMNTGSLVGMGDRTEINTDFDTEPESVKKEEIEENLGLDDQNIESGDKIEPETVEAVEEENTTHEN